MDTNDIFLTEALYHLSFFLYSEGNLRQLIDENAHPERLKIIFNKFAGRIITI
jgi:hypothetical protein